MGGVESEEGFAAFYVRHWPAVLSFLRARVPHSSAEDLAAEVFYIAWKKRDRIALLPAENRVGWLMKSARLLALQYHRGVSRSRVAVRRLAAAHRHEGFEAEVVAQIYASSVASDVLADLSEAERRSVGVYLEADGSYSSAARALGVPVGTLKTWMFRLRARVRTRIRSDGPSPSQ